MSNYAIGIVELSVSEYVDLPLRTRRAWYDGQMFRERLCICGIWLNHRAQRCWSCRRAFNPKVKTILRWKDAEQYYREPDTSIEDDHVSERYGDGVVVTI